MNLGGTLRKRQLSWEVLGRRGLGPRQCEGRTFYANKKAPPNGNEQWVFKEQRKEGGSRVETLRSLQWGGDRQVRLHELTGCATSSGAQIWCQVWLQSPDSLIGSSVGCSNVPGTCIRTLTKEFKNIECSLNCLSNTRTCASQRKSQTCSWVSNICGAQGKSIKRHSHIMCLNIWS